MNKSLENILSRLILYVSTVIVIPSGAFLSQLPAPFEEREPNELYVRASSLISELDKKPGTSHDDWSEAYEEALGRNYDVHSSHPTRLPDSDLQLIIEHHSPNT